MNDIVKIVLYVLQEKNLQHIKDTVQEYYCRHAPQLITKPPVEPIIYIPALHEPDMLIEIDTDVIADHEKSYLF